MANIASPEKLAIRARAIRLYTDSDLTVPEIAREFNVSTKTIRYWAKIAGVPLRGRGPIPPEIIAKAHELVADGASRNEAARTLGVSSQALRGHNVAGWSLETISDYMKTIKTHRTQLGLLA